jgi:hypothetical protein
MSVGVSQIEYWREASKPTATNTTAPEKQVKEGGPGATYLSYDVFMALSILGGLFALDHLYLRSPLTFLAKLIVNLLTFGAWWLYDASQAVFNRDVVKVFGLGIPGMGPRGIAAGVLANDVPDKKHMSFFLYGLALFLGGIFGLDSFVVGDKQSGIIRLVCLITGILAPIAIFWWLFNIGKFLFKTKDVTSLYWEYFGAPPPAEYGMSIGEKIVTKIPFLQPILRPFSRITQSIEKTAEGIGQNIENVSEVITDPNAPLKVVENTIDKVVHNTVDKFGTQIRPIVDAVIEPVVETVVQPILQAAEPIKETVNSGIQVAQNTVSTVREGIALGRNALNTGSALVGKTLNVVGQTANAATKALTLAPAAAAMSTGFTSSAASNALTKLQQQQQGGANTSNVLPYMLMGTLAIIAVSGFIVTYRRSKQNGQPRKDDAPPKPGVLRESNKEESS